jgi:hypothetical protein
MKLRLIIRNFIGQSSFAISEARIARIDDASSFSHVCSSYEPLGSRFVRRSALLDDSGDYALAIPDYVTFA